MKTRIVHTKIWDDNWFQDLSRATQFVFLYLITCESINICGAFEMPDRKIIYHTGVNSAELEKAKDELAGKVLFYDGWVLIENVDKYNSFNGPKNEVAREKEISYLPEKLQKYIRGIDTSIDTSIYTTHNHNHNHNHNTNHNQKREKKYSKISDLTEDHMQEIADHYGVALNYVRKLKAEMELYCESKGKTYKNYSAALQSWIRRKMQE